MKAIVERELGLGSLGRDDAQARRPRQPGTASSGVRGCRGTRALLRDVTLSLCGEGY